MNYKEIKRNVIRALIAFAGLNVFTACYGTPYDNYAPSFPVTGTVVDDKDNPVAGIRVSCDAGVIDTTGVDGRFGNVLTVNRPTSEISIYFADIDGAENGVFEGMSVPYDVYRREDIKVTLQRGVNPPVE